MTGFQPKNPNFERAVRDSFARQSLMTTLGASLTAVAPGRVEISAPILPGARQQQDFAHGGLVFSIGDSAAGYAALSLLPPGSEVLTVEMKINFLAAANGASLLARGRVIRPGRRIVVVAAEVAGVDADGAETPVALLQGTMIPVSR